MQNHGAVANFEMNKSYCTKNYYDRELTQRNAGINSLVIEEPQCQHYDERTEYRYQRKKKEC